MVKEKRQRKLCFSLYPERFFKVFLPDRSSHCMKFPPAFRKCFNGTLPFKSTIISPTKSSWQVDLLKVGNSLHFQKGWEQFVHDNSLVFGDFLVFSYDGNAIFRVNVYGPDGCEKKSTCHTEENQIAKKWDPKGLGTEIIPKHIEENDRHIKEVSEFKSDFPFFKVVMQPSYIYYGNLNVPSDFIKNHMSCKTSDKQGITLVYLDKSWPITVTQVRKFSGGWRKFLRDNSLQVGDICVFELVDSNNRILKVSIFRCLV